MLIKFGRFEYSDGNPIIASVLIHGITSQIKLQSTIILGYVDHPPEGLMFAEDDTDYGYGFSVFSEIYRMVGVWSRGDPQDLVLDFTQISLDTDNSAI